MASRLLVLTLGVTAIASPLSAQPAGAPDGSADTLYCMRIEAVTGSRVEPVRCWTRAEWTDQGVDLDRDWPVEGVRTIG